MDTKETQAMAIQDLEVKEKLDRQTLCRILRDWADALDEGREFAVKVQGTDYTIPADACERGKMDIEYEIDGGEYELQATMKWR